MKRTIARTSLALAVAGFLGTGAAVAQQNNVPAATPPKTTPPMTAPGMTTAPMPSTATPDAKAPTANQGAPGRPESGPSAFTKLDTKQRGYLNTDDVSKLHGFNFRDADKNSDGKLDAAEFNAAWATYGGAPK